MILNADDLHYFNEGVHEQAWRMLGAHVANVGGTDGVRFAVWAPNASRVAVVGDHNQWDGRVDLLTPQSNSGIWAGFVPHVRPGTCYKFEIHGQDGHLLPLKADPYARQMQHAPDTASIVAAPSGYVWQDADWMAHRRDRAQSHPYHEAPVSIYEVHLASWKRHGDGTVLGYAALAADLLSYVKHMGFTHVQLMPVSEFPFEGSWGYQPLGLYAPSTRFGDPDGLRAFVDSAHQLGIGVLLDWVPGHFPNDAHGLAYFDGTHLYEHADPRQGYHPDWNTCIFNYDRAEVRSYLLSNALYWLDEFHVDGLRVDAVASMLYLDYSRREGEWIPNVHGGRENLGALALVRDVNQRAYTRHPGIMMIAEESTAWPGVTAPVDVGGLGFGFKWNMGWMNDTLRYLGREPIHRAHHHNELTFGILYAYSENFILPLSHDEVVHGKRSILEKIPGEDWEKFATLRTFLAFQWTHPGKKLIFMGSEFAQRNEWSHTRSLDWHLLAEAAHQGIHATVRDLNALYQREPALWRDDRTSAGFEWVDADDHLHSVYSYWRRAADATPILCLFNFTPVARYGYRVGVPAPGWYKELLNTDAAHYRGSDQGNFGGLEAEMIPSHGQPWSLRVTLPPLSAVILRGTNAS
jgi:1,4-alpha-glucan branching enzyme